MVSLTVDHLCCICQCSACYVRMLLPICFILFYIIFFTVDKYLPEAFWVRFCLNLFKKLIELSIYSHGKNITLHVCWEWWNCFELTTETKRLVHCLCLRINATYLHMVPFPLKFLMWHWQNRVVLINKDSRKVCKTMASSGEARLKINGEEGDEEVMLLSPRAICEELIPFLAFWACKDCGIYIYLDWHVVNGLCQWYWILGLAYSNWSVVPSTVIIHKNLGALPAEYYYSCSFYYYSCY